MDENSRRSTNESRVSRSTERNEKLRKRGISEACACGLVILGKPKRKWAERKEPSRNACVHVSQQSSPTFHVFRVKSRVAQSFTILQSRIIHVALASLISISPSTFD